MEASVRGQPLRVCVLSLAEACRESPVPLTLPWNLEHRALGGSGNPGPFGARLCSVLLSDLESGECGGAEVALSPRIDSQERQLQASKGSVPRAL